MDLKDRVVIQTPLTELWTAEQILEHKRRRNLQKEDIKAILKDKSIEFVFADVGQKLRWTEKNKCFDTWKREIEKHLIEDNTKIRIDDYPDNYGYLASEWTKNDDSPVVLLEKIH